MFTLVSPLTTSKLKVAPEKDISEGNAYTIMEWAVNIEDLAWSYLIVRVFGLYAWRMVLEH